MDSRKSKSAALFVITNLVLFSVASSCYVCNHPNNPPVSPVPKPNPNPSPNNSNTKGKCPRDALKLGVCAKLLGGNIGTVIGTPPDPQCCSILGGLLDLEAAICLCTALKANVLGININIPISLSLLINTCGKNLPSDFICA